VDILDNKYQVEQLLGKGGMGEVYRATHLGTKRTVAVKVIHRQLSAHDQFVARFRREAEAATRLRHQNVVDVTDFGIAHTTNGPIASTGSRDESQASWEGPSHCCVLFVAMVILLLFAYFFVSAATVPVVVQF
jgi:serine/threonine protein kinase